VWRDGQQRPSFGENNDILIGSSSVRSAPRRRAVTIATPPVQITEEEHDVLRHAEMEGFVSADLYRQGDFNEEGFLLFGRLEVMCLKGLLRFVARLGDNERAPGDVRMVFAPA
jgi:hypothetical protein